MDTVLKKQVEGTISPRWPKHKVVKWLEWGAIPALLGLWIPNWTTGYVHLISGFTESGTLNLALPPVISFIGVAILFKACAEGIYSMGNYYKGVLWSGWLAVSFAGISFLWHTLIEQNYALYGALTILSIGLAAFFAAGFFWFTIAKVAEVSSEKRSLWTRNLVLILSIVALISVANSVVFIYLQNEVYIYFLRLTLVLFTIDFLLCRYGVYCFKTQKSIGAGFTTPPKEQFWV